MGGKGKSELIYKERERKKISLLLLSFIATSLLHCSLPPTPSNMSLTMKILSSIYNILIVLGLSWQVYEVSNLYFKFDVITHLDINFDEFIKISDMSVCIAYYDVLDFKFFNEMTESHLNPDAVGAQRNLQGDEVQCKITISQLFKLTPEEGMTIKSCFLRNPKTYTFEYYSTNEECLKHFQVQKYSFMDSICYRYAYKIFDDTANGNQNLIYNKRDIVFSPDDPGAIFMIRLADNLNRSTRLRIMMHPTFKLPWIEAAYTSEVFRSLDEKKIPENNFFSVTSSKITVEKLPPPFKSNCRNYFKEGLRDVHKCRQWCFRNKTVARFDKVPFNSRIRDPMNKKRICTKDMSENSVRTELIEFQTDCNEECNQDDCNSIITTTNVVPSQFERFSLMYKTPIESSLNLKFNEKLSFTEFIVYVTSCFGIWLGVSAYHSNPFRSDWVKTLMKIDWIRKYFSNHVRESPKEEIRVKRKEPGVNIFTIRNERRIEHLKRTIADQVFKTVISNLAQARARRSERSVAR